MADELGTRRNAAEGTPREDGRHSGDRSGQYGISDERRAQLARMEQEAGVQHEAVDQTVPQQHSTDPERSSAPASQPDVARPGDWH